MAIDLSRINISLDQFQKMATGDFNAGEVKLKSETKLTKINNHVHKLGWNTKEISHEEILAIKNAFVKALSAYGVQDGEINRIRKELGLAPDTAAPKSLAERSITPLTRQQIREIIDRNITAINGTRAANHEKAFKDSTQLYGTDPAKLNDLAAKRREASESTRRTLTESQSIANFQKVLEGDVAEIDGDDIFTLRKAVIAQRDAIIAKAEGNPKTEGNCILEYTTEAGQKLQFASGMSERETVRMLDEAYLLLNGGRDVRKRNASLVFCMTTSAGNPIPFGFKEMIDSVRAEATAVFGKVAVEQRDEYVHNLVDSNTMSVDADKLTAEGKAMTPDNIREAYRANCFTRSASNLIEKTVKGLLGEMGHRTSDCATIRADLQKIMPETFDALAKAKTADEAKAILDGAMGTIRETTARAAAAIDASDKLEDFMNEAFAREIGVKWNPANGKLASFRYLATKQGGALKTAIATGKVKANTPGEITAEFKKLAQKTAHAHAEFLRGADALGLSGDAVDRVKQHLLSINSFKLLDLDKAKTLAGDIDVKPLADAFAAKLPMEKIFEEIGKLFTSAESKIPALFEGSEEIGADESTRGVPLLLFMAMDKEPGLAAKLEKFLAGGDVQKAIDEDEGELPFGVREVNTYIQPPELAPAQLANDLGRPDMKPLYAQALMKAADAAGLGHLEPDVKLALFAAGTQAGDRLREALLSLPAGQAPTPSVLQSLATGLAKEIGEGEITAARDRTATAHVAEGTSPATAKILGKVLGSPGLPQNGTVKEKMSAFTAKINDYAVKEFANNVALNVAKYSVKRPANGPATERFDEAHSQFKRDLSGKMTVKMPGVQNISRNYEEARDQLLRFLTGDGKATYAAASKSEQRQVGIMMSFLNQTGPTAAKIAFNEPFRAPDSDYIYPSPLDKSIGRHIPVTFTLDKTADGSIKISMVQADPIQSIAFMDGSTYKLNPVTSHQETTMEFTIKAEDLKTVADQDWAQFDIDALRAQDDNGVDARYGAVPENYRLNITVESVNSHFRLDA